MSEALRCYFFGAEAAAAGIRRQVQASFPRLLVQAVDAGVASNGRLVEMIGEQTLRAAEYGNLLAKKVEVDLLLRLAGSTQISEAIRSAGAKPGRPFVLVVAGERTDLDSLEARKGATWKRLPSRPLSRDDFGKIERAALLDAERV